MSKPNDKSMTLEEAKKQGFNKVVPCNSALYQCRSEIVGKKGEMFFLYPLEDSDEEEKAYGYHKSAKVTPDPKAKKIEEFKRKLDNCLDHDRKVSQHIFDSEKDNPRRKQMYQGERDGLKKAIVEMYEESLGT